VAVYGVSFGLLGIVADRLAWLLIYGLGAGIALAGMSTLWVDALIVQSFRTGRGWRIGVNQLSTVVGHAGVHMLSMALLVRVGWRLSALYLGVLLLGMAVVLACCLPQQAALLEGDARRKSLPPRALRPFAPRLWSAVRSSMPWGQLTLVAGLWGCANALVRTWAHAVHAEEHGVLATWPTFVIGMGSMLLVSLGSGVLFGVLSDRIGRTQTLTLACLARAVAYALPLLWGHTLSVALAWLLQGLLVAALVPVLTPLLGEIYGLRHLGMLVGLTAVGQHLGAVLGAWLGAYGTAWPAREPLLVLSTVVAFLGAAVLSRALPAWREAG
jgi:MFS family permease